MPIKIRKIKTGLFLCFLMGLLLPLQVGAQEKPVGKVIGLTGFIEILVSEPVAQVKKGEAKKVSTEVWQQLKKKRPVYQKDTFRTGRKSRLKILFPHCLPHRQPGGLRYAWLYQCQSRPLIANQAGTVLVSNSDPNVGLEKKAQWFEPVFTNVAFSDEIDFFAQIPGGNEVPMGPMTKSTILEGLPPTPPVPLTPAELQTIRNVVLAKIGISSKNKALVKVEEKKAGKKDDKDDGDEGGGDEGGGEGGGDSSFTSEFEEGGEGGGEQGGDGEKGGGDFRETKAEPSEETDAGCTS